MKKKRSLTLATIIIVVGAVCSVSYFALTQLGKQTKQDFVQVGKQLAVEHNDKVEPIPDDKKAEKTAPVPPEKQPTPTMPTMPMPLGPTRSPPPPRQEKPLLTRTGARIASAAWEEKHYVKLEPNAAIKWPKFDETVRGKQFAFEVVPFEQKDKGKRENGFAVDRGGDIVTTAVAVQLESMGYTVSLDLGKMLQTVQKELEGKFREKLPDVPLAVRLTGTTSFWIETANKDQSYQVAAHLDVTVSIVGLGSSAGGPIYERAFHLAETAAGDKLSEQTDRYRTTATKVVQSFVQQLFGDPKLESSLIEFVKQSTQSRT